MVPMVRRWFESFDQSTYSLDLANAHLNKKLSLANERIHGTHLQKPLSVFIDQEAEKLSSLPSLRYEPETIQYVTVRSDGYVCVDNKYYRIDARLKKEKALVMASSSQVSIYCRGKLIEVYVRIKDPFITKACKDHYKESFEKTLEDHGHYLKKASQIGANVERFVNIVLARGDGFVDTRVVWGILTLNKTYEQSDIDKACKSALDLSQVNLRTVRQLLSTMAQPKKKPKVLEENLLSNEPAVQPAGGRFERPMSEYKKHLRLVYSSQRSNVYDY
jgi:hypothetical protein